MNSLQLIIKSYENKVIEIDKGINDKKEFLSEVRKRLTRPETTCYSDDDYQNMKSDYRWFRARSFATRQAYIQVIEDLKELL